MLVYAPVAALFCCAVSAIRAVWSATSFFCVSDMLFGACASIELVLLTHTLVIRGKRAGRKQARSRKPKSRIAFCPALPLNSLFVLSRSENFAPTPKTLIGASALLIFVAAIFGLSTSRK